MVNGDTIEIVRASEYLKKLVLEAISKLACGGYCHSDLKWEHVGFLIDSDGNKAVIIDFTQSKEGASKDEIEAKMLETLGLNPEPN